MTGTGISVVIPAYEAWPLLERSLGALLADCRALPGIPWQIVVVDNESDPSLAERASAMGTVADNLLVVRRTGLRGRHFQPGAARNLGISLARHDCVILLDADCVVSSGLIQRYHDLVYGSVDTVYIGHRVFVDASGLSTAQIAGDRAVLDRAPPVASACNYGEAADRRMAELRRLDHHRHPWDLMYACNMAVHRAGLGPHRFNAVFDGHYGYEDVELGYRLFQAGRRFRYVPEAFVYHLEGNSVSEADRVAGRIRNFALAVDLIPGLLDVRRSSTRTGAVPAGTGFGGDHAAGPTHAGVVPR